MGFWSWVTGRLCQCLFLFLRPQCTKQVCLRCCERSSSWTAFPLYYFYLPYSNNEVLSPACRIRLFIHFVRCGYTSVEHYRKQQANGRPFSLPHCVHRIGSTIPVMAIIDYALPMRSLWRPRYLLSSNWVQFRQDTVCRHRSARQKVSNRDPVKLSATLAAWPQQRGGLFQISQDT